MFTRGMSGWSAMDAASSDEACRTQIVARDSYVVEYSSYAAPRPAPQISTQMAASSQR